MKKILLPILGAFALSATAVLADETVTTTRTTYGDGTLTEYSPGSSFVVKEASGPVTYGYGKSVTYVTKSGKILTDDDARTRIKVGIPVHVQYATEGDRRLINRVEIDD